MGLSDNEKAELEYYRQQYAQPAPQQDTSGMPTYYGHIPPPAQDALSEEEQAAFWPDDLDYLPKYQIAERHRQVYSAYDLRKSE